MATLQLILEKLHYIALNLLFVVVLPVIIVFTVDKLIGLFIILISRQIILDWQNKRVSININERTKDV